MNVPDVKDETQNASIRNDEGSTSLVKSVNAQIMINWQTGCSASVAPDKGHLQGRSQRRETSRHRPTVKGPGKPG